MFEQISEILSNVFGGDTPREPLLAYQVAARTAVVYLIGLVIVRVGKSRMLSRVTSLDLILAFILGSLLSRAMTGSASISGTAAAGTMLVAVHWALTAVAYRSHWFGNLLKGRSVLLVEHGRQQEDAMRRSHISEHDLLEQVRLRGVESIEDVRLAYKERNGDVSVIRREA